MANFFVIGLPRSRTAWLANFLTQGEHFCYHEAINGCSSIAAYKAKLGNQGDSGTGMMMFDMNALFPDAPIVIIESDPKKSIDFCHQTYGYYDPNIIYHLRDRLDTIDGLRVLFKDINQRLPEIWSHLIGEGFDRRRADMLIKLQVQVMNPFDIDLEAAKVLFDEHSLPET